MAKLVEKYHIAKRLLEINIMVEKKYNLEERFSNYYINEEFVGSFTNLNVPEDMLYYNSAELMLERLNTRFKEGVLTKADVDLAVMIAESSHNESIGVYTEEFWMLVLEEGLPVKRKKNRLLNILKKGYLSLFEDKEAFYADIRELLDSDIFNKVYNEDIRNQIFELMALTNQRLSNKIDKLLKKKNLSDEDMSEIWDINTDLECYGTFFKIPEEQIQALKNFISLNESYYKRQMGWY